MPAKFFTALLLVSLFTGSLAMGAPSKPKESTKANDSDLFASGTEKLLKENYAAAEKDLRAAVRANDKNAAAHNNLAFVLRKQGSVHFDEALQHYNRAIELNDKLAEAYMYRGVLYQAMGQNDLALADQARLLELGRGDLAKELEWVLDNGKEKEPPQFFGVVQKE
jgi:tetratricopeptide (TPR) repeat protein